MKKGLIVFDIDGTIVDSPGQKLPSEKVISAFRNISLHYYLSPATGRSWSFANNIIQALGISDPCIVAGGTQIRKPNGEIIWQADMSRDALVEALRILAKYKDHSIIYNDSSEEDYLNNRGIKTTEVNLEQPIYFLESIFIPNSDAEELRSIIATVPGLTCSMVNAQRPNTKDIHVTRDDATKEFAIARLLDILKVQKRDTIGIGDGHNDLHLFSAVEKKIAMGNAVPELKNASDQVIGTVYEDAIADYFYTLIG